MTLLFIFFSVVLLGALFFSRTLVAYLTHEMEINIQAWLMETSKRGAALVAAEELETYQTPDDMSRSDYQALRYKLADFSNDSGVLYVYYLRALDNDNFQFIIDNDFDEATRVGLDTTPASIAQTPGLPEAFLGQVGITELGSYMTGWEGLFSAYAPIFDNNGNVAAVCGIDINDEIIVSARQREKLLGFLSIAATILVFASGILCFASYRREALLAHNVKKTVEEFARSIVSSGQEHYQKMNELFTALRIMRHDSKYHQNVTLGFLRKGETDKAIEYLGGLQDELSKYELIHFCDNQVINALLLHYAQRCKESNIDFNFKTSMPAKLSISDYDMCIVVGNLLENAFEASQNLNTNKKINLDMMLHNEQIVLRVENNCKAETAEKENTVSDRGLGLRSVQLITERYSGNLSVKQIWHPAGAFGVFTATVLINVG